MTDWKAMKKAAEGLPLVSVTSPEETVPKPMSPGFYPTLVEYGRNERPKDSSAMSKSRFSASGHPFSSISSSYLGGDSLPGTYFATMRRSDIRPALYGNAKGWETEQEWAMNNRWRRIMSLAATPQDRANLEARRRAGQMPPIIMRGALPKGKVLLDDRWFGRPGEYVQATVVPGGRGSTSWPWANKFTVASPYDWDLARLFREESAHNITPTPIGKGVQSVLGAVPGGNEGNDAYQKGGVGSYELNPGEMTRLALLAKAAAHRLGYGPIRSVENLEQFLRQGSWKAWNGASEPSPDTPDYPYGPNNPGSLDMSTKSDSLLKVIDTLRQRAERETDPNLKERYLKEYNDLYMSLQDAVEMARVGRRRNTMNA